MLPTGYPVLSPQGFKCSPGISLLFASGFQGGKQHLLIGEHVRKKRNSDSKRKYKHRNMGTEEIEMSFKEELWERKKV